MRKYAYYYRFRAVKCISGVLLQFPVDFGGTATLAPGLTGMTNEIAVRVFGTTVSRMIVSKSWASTPKLD